MICVKHKIMDSAARRAEARASAGWDYLEFLELPSAIISEICGRKTNGI